MTSHAKGRPAVNTAALKRATPTLIVRRHAKALDVFLGVRRTYAPTELDWQESALSYEQRAYAAIHGKCAA